ncbi:MAG: hypothetical protein KIT66_08345 [Chitinophagaceae bacterium]|nr:hypothetical protein [Chitinophagaceae bacterium]MCZ2395290.1 hypothetical protein [Chitinophagales bacterium]
MGRSKEAGNEHEAQEGKIAEYAKAKGVWVDNTYKKLSEKYGEPLSELEKDGNQEATVWYDGANVKKAQNTYMYGFDLQYKLEGITLHNFYFPESALRVVDFVIDKNGDFQVLIEQPFINVTKSILAKINRYLSNIGFSKNFDNSQ